jgi:hypothetical protein
VKDELREILRGWIELKMEQGGDLPPIKIDVSHSSREIFACLNSLSTKFFRMSNGGKRFSEKRSRIPRYPMTFLTAVVNACCLDSSSVGLK